MKNFQAELPNFCSDAVGSLRTTDAAALVNAIAALKPPFDDEMAAELVALGYVHTDPNVRKKAMGLVQKHVAGADVIKTTFKSMANQDQHVVNQRVRALEHPLRLGIAKAILWHRMMAGSVPFEEDARVRKVMLETAVDHAKREEQTALQLGGIYWYWQNQGGWRTTLAIHHWPEGLIDEITALRERHPFDGLILHAWALTDLPAEVAKAKPWLRSLSLDWMPIEHVPDVVWELENLEKLSLLGTQLADISPRIAELPNLRRLDLGNMKKMKEVPASVCALTALEDLRVSNGSIRKLPPAMSGMTGLHKLELQSTSIAKVPKLPNLKSIRLLYSKVPDDQIAELEAAGVTVER